nr:extracellular solute-binding protein [uncultured Marvinbryantia sp.]
MNKKMVGAVLMASVACGALIPAQASEEYDLTVYSIETTDPDFDTWLAAAEEATGLNINVVAAPTDTDTRQQKITTILSTGDTSVDVIQINDEMSTAFKNTGWLEGLNDTVMTEDILDNFAVGYIEDMITSADGQIVGVPGYCGYLSMWVNQEIMDEVGIESIDTLDDFKAFLAAASEKEGRYGYGGSWEKTYVFNEIAQFVNMFGGDYYDWSNEGNRKALEFMKEMVDNGWTSLDQLADKYEQMNQKFIDGDYGVVFYWGTGSEYADAGMKGDDKIHMYKVPTFEKGSIFTDSWSYVLNSASENKEAAYTFLKWIASEDGEAASYNCFDRYPARSDVAETVVPEDNDVKAMYATYAEELEVHGRPMLPQTMEFISEMGTLFQQYVQGEISLDDFCAQAQEAVEANQ